MKAVRVHELGPAQVLRCEDVSDPEPGAGEVLVRCGSRLLAEGAGGRELTDREWPFPTQSRHAHFQKAVLHQRFRGCVSESNAFSLGPDTGELEHLAGKLDLSADEPGEFLWRAGSWLFALVQHLLLDVGKLDDARGFLA